MPLIPMLGTLRPWLCEEDHIKITKELSSGVYGDAYKGTVFGQDGNCVIKCLNSFQSPAASKDFWEELLILTRSGHKNILPLVGIVRGDECWSIITEFQRNRTLRDAITHYQVKKKWPVGFSDVRLACVHFGVANALSYLHSVGIVHGDLKPSNVCLGRGHRPLLTDFGSKYLKKGDKCAPKEELLYVAPELLNDLRASPSKESDVYSFGMLLYTSLVKSEISFASGKAIEMYDSAEMIRKIMKGKRFERGEIAEEQWNLIQRCWQNDEHERPTITEIVEVLRNISQTSEYQAYITELMDDGPERAPKNNADERLIASKGCYEKAMISLSRSIVRDCADVVQTQRSISKCMFKCKHCDVMYKISRDFDTGRWDIYQKGAHFHEGKKGKPLIQVLEYAINEGLARQLSGVKLIRYVRNETRSETPASTIYYHMRKNPNKDWKLLWKQLPALGQRMEEAELRFQEFRNQENVLESVAFELPGAKFCKSDAFLGLVFVDGCHLNDRLRSTLLCLATITADHVVIPIAAMICPSEDKVSYGRFFRFIKQCLPGSFTIMSDQSKAMIPAFGEAYRRLGNIKRLPCMFHILKALKGQAVRWELTELLTCDHTIAYKAMKECFKRDHPRIFGLLKTIIAKMSYMSNSFAGIFETLADSAIESFNSAILEQRGDEAVELIGGLITFANHQLDRQLAALPRSEEFCQSCLNTIEHRKNRAKQLQVRKVNDKFIVAEAFVVGVTVDYELQVLDDELDCSCQGYKRLGIPCRHMYAVAREFHFESSHIPRVWSQHAVATIRQAVEKCKVTVNMLDLEETDISLRDVSRRPGRPRKRRFRPLKEYLAKYSNIRCGACGEKGHTRRSHCCKANQGKQRRQQRKKQPTFRERVAEVIQARRSRSLPARLPQVIVPTWKL